MNEIGYVLLASVPLRVRLAIICHGGLLPGKLSLETLEHDLVSTFFFLDLNLELHREVWPSLYQAAARALIMNCAVPCGYPLS